MVAIAVAPGVTNVCGGIPVNTMMRKPGSGTYDTSYKIGGCCQGYASRTDVSWVNLTAVDEGCSINEESVEEHETVITNVSISFYIWSVKLEARD